MEIYTNKDWKDDRWGDPLIGPFDFKELMVRDIFYKGDKLRQSSSPERVLNDSETKQLEEFISQFNFPLPQDWRDRTLLERFAHVITYNYWLTFCVHETDQDGEWSEIDDATPMYELIKEIDDFSIKQVKYALPSQNKELSYASYKKCLFPLIVESLFKDFYIDQGYKSIRYRAWYDQELKNFIQKEEDYESKTSYRKTELNSPGHLKICKRLETDGTMFMFEAPTYLDGDKKIKRFIDLVVIKNNRAVIVEIDGWSYHRSRTQQEDDNNRDLLIRKNFSNTLRLSHDEAEKRTDEAMKKIYDALDPNRGLVS